MIPKIIWQTYKTPVPPNESLDCIKTWLDKNPSHVWYYFDDARCEKFIRDHFDDEFYNMYVSLPYGVMKSDAWRIAIVYIYGGVYADLDTVCLRPIDEWTNDRELVVSIEPPTHDGIANFCFAASPKHPAIYQCLEHLLINYNGPNYLDKLITTGTPIQNFGQHAFASGIKEYFIKHPDDTSIHMYSQDDNAFTPIHCNKSLVHHRTGSVYWTSNDYVSWRKQQHANFGIFDNAKH